MTDLKQYTRHFLTGFIVILFTLTSIHAIISLYRITTTFAPDFSVYYAAANNVWHHRNPYTDSHVFTGLGYPLMTAFFYIPFLLFPYQVAQGIFVIFSFLALWIGVILSLKILKIDTFTHILFLFSLAFLSFPVKFTLGMGQSNLVANAFLLGSIFLFLHKKTFQPVIFFVIAVLLKPILGFLILFFIFQKAWKITLATLSLLFIITITTYFFYPHEMVYYITVMIPHMLNPLGREVYYNQGLMGFISRLVTDGKMRSLITLCIDCIILSGLFIIILKNNNPFLLLALLLTALVLLDSLSWQHHFVFLLFPFVFAAKFVFQRQKTVLFIFLFVSYCLVSSNIKTPQRFENYPLNLLLSHTFYGAVLLLAILFFIAPPRLSTPLKKKKDNSYDNC